MDTNFAVFAPSEGISGLSQFTGHVDVPSMGLSRLCTTNSQ